jgi:hypothetical protein
LIVESGSQPCRRTRLTAQCSPVATITVAATNADMAAFVRQLRVGQQVNIVYEGALAISVEPMR